MARKCEICGKVAVSGHLISHSHIRSKRLFSPNIQRIRAMVNGAPRQINVCTRCLRSGRVVRAL
ncbi:MAG: 50S ribosomal protein L28 [Firmicutes bacterium RBG_13_65_8]|nr:MAG: 50S ribosomal protein L28 [Firmicutes bacterium RBG_13_65_8]